MRLALIAVTMLILSSAQALCQEPPYFATYSHQLEEPGNLEISTAATVGVPRARQRAFLAPWAEFEYGMLGRWTTELYAEGQGTARSGAVFTGWRFENRVRPLLREHRFNPVLYLEYEDINEADKIEKEVTGHSPDLSSSNGELRGKKDRELEGKIIVSSNTHNWNFSENFIVEKNFSASEGVEFGYAVGASTLLAHMASAQRCVFCRENFSAGAELFGGLGSTHGFGLADTAHYLGPVFSWQLSDNNSLHFSPVFGLTHSSAAVLFRVGYTYEVQAFGRRMANWMRGKP